MRASLWVAAVMLCALISANVANAEVITFDDFPVNAENGDPIDGGDLDTFVGGYGTTSSVKVYSGVYGPNGRLGDLQWWLGYYFGDLDDDEGEGVAMDNTYSDVDGDQVADPGSESFWGEFRLVVVDPAANSISLDSFLIAGFTTWTQPDDMELLIQVDYDVAPNSQVWDFGTPEIPNDGYEIEGDHRIVTPLPADGENAKAITIRWNFPYNIAVDDITYTVTPVPEPATLVSWVLGLAGLGLVGYRRYRRTLV